MTDRIPLVLKFQNRPDSDRAAWNALFAEGDIFEGAGPCRHWSESSRVKRCQSYGQWLSFLYRHEPAVLDLPPSDRVQLELARRYLAECEARIGSRSVANLFGDLYEVARTFDPEGDWRWLALVSRRLLAKGTRHALPPAPDITSREIWRWTIERLAALEKNRETAALRKAIW